jgi:hypothetical protein
MSFIITSRQSENFIFCSVECENEDLDPKLSSIRLTKLITLKCKYQIYQYQNQGKHARNQYKDFDKRLQLTEKHKILASNKRSNFGNMPRLRYIVF